jgi:hypothetical protein
MGRQEVGRLFVDFIRKIAMPSHDAFPKFFIEKSTIYNPITI